MVMDQFVTTYRKDYLWPYVKTLGVRPQPDRLYQPQYNDPNRPNYPCECHAIGDPQATNQQLCSLLGPQAYEEESWSRVGPMGPLLDPKIYPAKVSSAPETQISRFNQPNVFLAKLQEKYPFIYECLRTAPPDDLLARINRDRLRSTYQVDFCKMNEYPSAPYDELLRAAGVDGLPPCPEPVILPGDVCKMYTKSRVTGSGGAKSGQPCGGIYKSKEAAYCVGSCKGALSSMTAGASEYQDAISRLGQLIIRDRIHDPTVKRSVFTSKPK
ncbi:uncharacterized protein LOC109533751 isoform X3 [Dendroctonus ponderosae]|uniref:uncharacterized protein LOC109533751 isoform X3 n=1 Tax=Dendroctonus ponderosae TaxID=77166 RepID=UPI00203518F5|nr:uncharacterized protein LOC109533751 isoform X3 [Dendroctonus ponderosae]KAH1028080.1 hypothetical protein HUJ05_001477 [Dendroctonus ponderosae]